MREVERIREQHTRAFTGPAWPGPAVFEVLRAVRATTAVAWRRALALLRRRHRALQGALAGLSERHLEQRATGQSYTVYVMVHGEIQHALYHAGQIALLRKARLG